jgi:4-hydroxythreonine-4-phosphate dehydrogenase
MSPKLPLLAVTMGDPSGIGPEVVVKTLARPEIAAGCRALVVGDARVIERAAGICGVGLPVRPVEALPADLSWPAGEVVVLHEACDGAEAPAFGVLSAESGRAAVRAVERAIDLALTGRVRGIVTSPLNKEAMRLAGYPYDGHTELLAERTGSTDVCMLLAGERLRVSHVTGHRSLRDAAVGPSPERIVRVVELTASALAQLGFARPRIAVAGLNPHAGEGGLFGRDELDVIGPAVQTAAGRLSGAAVNGPLPPDTIFRRAALGEFDAVVAMYHDQGHIPIKLIEFDSAVNVTLGLPILRTSPDHGTAFDIAGTGVANPANMIAAMKLAARMAAGRAP